MPNIELSENETQQLEKSRYLVAYLVKLHQDHAIDKTHAVSVTIRGNSESSYVIDVDGHTIEF
jgi:hypothetical protein